MIIKLIFPKDLGKEMEDEIINWMEKIIKNKSHYFTIYPLNYVDDIEVDR